MRSYENTKVKLKKILIFDATVLNSYENLEVYTFRYRMFFSSSFKCAFR